MRLRHTPHELPGLPDPVGAHHLAWSYLLDAVCADAYHAGVTELELALPAAFAAEIEARRPFPGSVAPSASGGTATAVLAVGGPRAEQSRHYRLRFGALAPAALRASTRVGVADPEFELVARLHVYTLRTRLLGVPMRLLNLLERPRPADRALIALRHAFASHRPTPSYYLLEIRARSGREG